MPKMTVHRQLVAAPWIWLRSVAQWWLLEATHLLPKRVRETLGKRQPPHLNIWRESDEVCLQLAGSKHRRRPTARYPAAAFSDAAIESYLRSERVSRGTIAINLCIPARNFFTRRFLVPVEAANQLDTVVRSNLRQRLPFQENEIWTGHRIAHSPTPDRLQIEQWIVRRDYVERELRSVALQLSNVTHIVGADGPSTGAAMTVAVRHEDGARAGLFRASAAVLCGAAMSLAIITLITDAIRRQDVLRELNESIAAVRPAAVRVRTAMEDTQKTTDAFTKLRMAKARKDGLVDVWLELTRLLPDHTWLTEVRLNRAPDAAETEITIIGLSNHATSLINIIEESTALHSARAVAPTTLDPHEKKERFAIAAKVLLPLDTQARR